MKKKKDPVYNFCLSDYCFKVISGVKYMKESLIGFVCITFAKYCNTTEI